MAGRAKEGEIKGEREQAKEIGEDNRRKMRKRMEVEGKGGGRTE